MELQDLNQDERLALVALLEATLMADRNVSREEGAELEEVIDAFGEETYRHTLDEAERRLGNEDALRGFLQKITRQEARELIYGTVLDAATVNSIVAPEESELLDWLAEAWNVEAELEPV